MRNEIGKVITKIITGVILFWGIFFGGGDLRTGTDT